jgi:hypothetical protein
MKWIKNKSPTLEWTTKEFPDGFGSRMVSIGDARWSEIKAELKRRRPRRTGKQLIDSLRRESYQMMIKSMAALEEFCQKSKANVKKKTIKEQSEGLGLNR